MYLPAESTQSSYTPVEAGTYSARCYRFIDLGTQKITAPDGVKLQHKVSLSWELPTELMEDGRPYTISKRYTWSMHEKANLRKDLEAWRNKKFAPEELGEGGFNIKKVLGTDCTLTIVHKDGNEGNTFANVQAVSAVMKGMQVPELTNETLYLALTENDFDSIIFDTLPDRIKEDIKKSPQYQELLRPKASQVSADDYARVSGGSVKQGSTAAMLNDDIPFVYNWM